MKPTRLVIATAVFTALLASGSAQTFETEPNDTIDKANPILLGVPVRGQLLTTTDVDIFAVSVPQAGALSWTFETSPSRITSFLNSSGVLLAQNISLVSVPAAGVYYIKISAPSSFFSQDPYLFTVTFAQLVPTITTQPINQNAVAGSTATLSVTANGVPLTGLTLLDHLQ